MESEKLDIPKDFVEVLKNEGNKVLSVCDSLNGNSYFNQVVESIKGDEVKEVWYKVEHLLLHDIVKIYRDFLSLNVNQDSIKAKFILIFLYEKIQGKDLSLQYSLERLNELVKTPRFNNNVNVIKDTLFFTAKLSVKNQFLLPGLLKKIDKDAFQVITSFMYRVASLLVKSDNGSSESEEKWLKDLFEVLNNPQVHIDGGKWISVSEDDSLEIVMGELNELIGLEEVKKNVGDLANFLKVQKLREENSLKSVNTSLHTVFMGPPGTGKTTVARLLGRVFKHLGYLESGHLVETDRAGLVAGYVGQTAIKTDEIINSAKGGVLFIDEAYSLSNDGFNDFGSEAIEIILKRMEDLRGELVVIVAGYPEEMEGFIKSNPGLQSRFNRYFQFDHFTVDALLKVFKMICKKADFELSKDAEEKLLEILDRVHEKRDRTFGNARVMRNLFEKIIERQANRVIKVSPITESILKVIEEEDIPEILKTVKELAVFDEKE